MNDPAKSEFLKEQYEQKPTVLETINSVAQQHKAANYRIDELFKLFSTGQVHGSAKSMSEWSIPAINSLIHAIHNKHTTEEIDKFIEDCKTVKYSNFLLSLNPEQKKELTDLGLKLKY